MRREESSYSGTEKSNPVAGSVGPGRTVERKRLDRPETFSKRTGKSSEMKIRQAILVELFAVVLILFGGFYWMVEIGNSFQLFVNLGLVVGVLGVIAGFVGETD